MPKKGKAILVAPGDLFDLALLSHCYGLLPGQRRGAII
jgi:hypothetical protein